MRLRVTSYVSASPHWLSRQLWSEVHSPCAPERPWVGGSSSSGITSPCHAARPTSSFESSTPTRMNRKWLTEESMAFHEPTRFAEFEVIFLGRHPQTVWSFHGLTARERPGRQSDGQPVSITEDRRATVQFVDVYGGLYRGAAWEW